MNRLQKKCFVASGVLHGLLVIVLVVGPAFLPSKEKTEVKVLQIIPDRLIDGATSGGGNPAVTPVEPAPAAVAPAEVVRPPEKTVEAEPPKPKPEPEKIKVEKTEAPIAEPVKKPEPKKPEVKKKEPESDLTKKPVQRTQKKPAAEKVETPKPAVDISKTVVRNPREKKEAEERARQAQAEKDFRKGLAGLVTGSKMSIAKNSAGTTTVELSGPGGAAFANYKDFVYTVYKTKFDAELIRAGDIADGRAEVAVSVTIGRDGKVISGRVTKGSGNVALDKLVKKMLDNVSFVAPFPEASKDAERTFDIIFELNPKNQLG